MTMALGVAPGVVLVTLKVMPLILPAEMAVPEATVVGPWALLVDRESRFPA